MVYSYQGYMHGSCPSDVRFLARAHRLDDLRRLAHPIGVHVSIHVHVRLVDFSRSGLARFEELLTEKQFAGGKDAGGDQT